MANHGKHNSATPKQEDPKVEDPKTESPEVEGSEQTEGETKAEAKPKATQYKEFELKDLRKAQAEIAKRIGTQTTNKAR